MKVLLVFVGYTPVFAHLGHWYVSLPVFGGPVLIIAIAVKISEHRERRRARAGNTRHLRVEVGEHEGQTVLMVHGALDYPALLEIEDELVRVAPHTSKILLDLSRLTKVKEDCAWGLAESVNRVAGAEVNILVTESPTLHELIKISALEGLKVARTPDPPLGSQAESGTGRK